MERSQKSVGNLINNKKRNFYENKIRENTGKPKELWKTLKSMGLDNTKASSVNFCLKDDEQTLCFDTKSKIKVFKNFFSGLADELLQKLPCPSNRFGMDSVFAYYQSKGIGFSFFKLLSVSEEYVLKLLQETDKTKAPGIDGISGFFLKAGAEVLCKPITELCNLSISKSTFPSECKIAKLKPLYKKGPRTEAKNYRPISLLPIISKVIEKVVQNQTQCYLDQNNILYKFQSGFRSHYSSNSCLSYLQNKIANGFDSGLMTGMILIDLQKAFDTINHTKLLKKLKALGFSEESILWFQSYLTNRTFLVSVDNILSSSCNLKCGVPQGSILGPLLFLIYVNDMPQASDKCDLFLYADDSCLIFQSKDIDKIESVLNAEFSNLCDWFVDNKLSIHFGQDKTKSILFCSKGKFRKGNKLNISYNDIEIKQYSKVEYLGCILDETLSGESMALHAIKKINSKIKFLYRQNSFLNKDLRRLLCNALIQPHFDYAISAWFPNLNKALQRKLQISQNKCIRFCLQSGNRSHIGVNEFKALNWLPVKERSKSCLSTLVYKFFNNKSPVYMSDIFIPLDLKRSTRSSFQKLYQPNRKTSQGQNCLSYLGPSVWNSIPDSVKKSSSTISFKHNLKKHYFDVMSKHESDYFIR